MKSEKAQATEKKSTVQKNTNAINSNSNSTKTAKVKSSANETKTTTKKTATKSTKAAPKISTNTTKKNIPTKTSTLKKTHIKNVAVAGSPATKKETKKKKPKKSFKKIIEELPFQIDDFVFYPNEGIGQIIKIEERKFVDELMPYYVIKFISQKMVSRIPTKNIKLLRIRKIISKNYVQKILKMLETINDVSELPWKDRLLKHQEVLKKGNALETTEMLTSLYIRSQNRQLSFQERQYYEFAFNALRDELSIVLSKEKEEISLIIKENLKRARDKMRQQISDAETLSE